MFLKTVPPVVAVHSEWSTGKSFSLPLCFNDSASDSDFTSSGTPIPHKVQMIIDSLRSTQSSDMSDEVPARPQSALDLPRHTDRKVKSRHSEALARPRRTASDCKREATGLDASEGADSDDSVDRGIEEAIQEYLKEKVDHKRKVEPTTSPLHASKVQLRDLGIPDPSKQLTHSNGNKVLTAINHVQIGLKGVQPLVALKKKKKKPSKENPFRKMDTAKALPSKSPPSCSPCADRSPPPLQIKEEELLDSSSDDGIEEAIQKFQQEQKDRLDSVHTRDGSDSSSDDGIEEAIQHYQQEKEKQEKHKLLPKLTPLVFAQHSKMPTIVATDHASVQPCKTLPKKKNSSNNSRKKSAVVDKDVKCTSPKVLAVSQSLNLSPSHCLRAQEDAACSVRAEEPAAEQQIHSTLTVNTTAELMCAEAILDISKTVMPAAFVPNLNIVKANEAETSPLFPTVFPPQPDEKSDESSVDSEDGIEQEIRKFLELKAKMHEQLPTTATAAGPVAPAGPIALKASQKKKAEDDQSKAIRLSLSRKRKRKDEDGGSNNILSSFSFIKEEPQHKPESLTDASPVTASQRCSPVKHSRSKQSSPLHRLPETYITMDKVSSCASSSPTNALRPPTGLERNYSSDKSSSLDSDEDLDAAIKDLLKTKKRVKKKVRDMKLKARKRLKFGQSATHKTLKKPKPVTEQKNVFTAKPLTQKSSKELTGQTMHDISAKPKGLKPNQSSKPKAFTDSTDVDQEKGAGGNIAASSQPSVHVDEDSSSVDSDDSIEQEIRRFLAEKAKVSVPVATITDARTEEPVCTVREIKVEEQEMEGDSTPARSQCLQRTDLQLKEEQPQDTSTAIITRLCETSAVTIEKQALPQTGYCITEDGRTGGQLARTLDVSRSSNLEAVKDRASFSEDSFVVTMTSLKDTQCQVQHQNLFLMKPENCSISDVRETPMDFRDLPVSIQNRSRIPLKEVISAVCPSPPPVAPKPCFSSPSETPVVARGDWLPSVTPESRTDSFYLHSRVKRRQQDQAAELSPSVPHSPSPHLTPTTRQSTNPQHLCPHLPPNPTHLSCMPLPPALSKPLVAASVVRLRRDQAAVIPLSPHKTNHLQLRNRQEEKETERERQGERRSDVIEEGEDEEKCIDETDVESGEERRAEQQRTDKRQPRTSQ